MGSNSVMMANDNRLSATQMREIARNWFSNIELKDGRIIIENPGKQRQNIITPLIAKLIPPVAGVSRDGRPCYYASYEVEIRPTKAVVRIMCWRNRKTPQTIVDTYKNLLVPMTGKKFRDEFRTSSDDQYYNKTFGSLSIDVSTTPKDLISMLETAWNGIVDFEKELSYRL